VAVPLNFAKLQIRSFSTCTLGRICLSLLFSGCATLIGTPPNAQKIPLKVVVGPVILEAPITKSTQIHSFEEASSPEAKSVVLTQLIDEIQTKAQQLLTEHLARQEGLRVVPFAETRRLLADLAPSGTKLEETQLRELGNQTGAQFVISGVIHDYGAVRWQYWVTGWLLHVSIATTIVGVATAWNPIAIGAYLAVDATTDFPLWWGGASVFGWAFRPVRVHVDTVQFNGCEGLVWTDDELAVKVPGKMLEEYPPEDRRKKEIQLEANLNRATAELAETIGQKLQLQPCTDDGRPAKIRGFSIMSLLDLLL